VNLERTVALKLRLLVLADDMGRRALSRWGVATELEVIDREFGTTLSAKLEAVDTPSGVVLQRRPEIRMWGE